MLLQYSTLQGRDRRGGERKEGEDNCKYGGVALEECIPDLIEALTPSTYLPACFILRNAATG